MAQEQLRQDHQEWFCFCYASKLHFAVVFLIFIPLGCTLSVLHMFSKAGFIWYKLLSNVMVIASPFACKITFEFGISFILTLSISVN